MKPKTFSRKLSLNKKTIAHLNGKEMKKAHGGYIPPDTRLCIATGSCPTNNTNAGGACCCGGDTTEVIC